MQIHINLSTAATSVLIPLLIQRPRRLPMRLPHSIILALPPQTQRLRRPRIIPIIRLRRALQKLIPQPTMLDGFRSCLEIRFVRALARLEPGDVFGWRDAGA